MSNLSRIQAGVPTGGQFATAVKAEASGTLADTPPTPDREDPDDAALSADIRAYREAKARIELRSARIVARRILTQWPAATHLQLDVSDQGDDSMIPDSVRNAAGDELADAEDLDDFDEELAPMVWNLHDDDGDWTTVREYLAPHGRAPALDLKAAAAIPDSVVNGRASDTKPAQMGASDNRAASREAVEAAVGEVFANLSDREAERFEAAALEAGLLGRCSACGENHGLTGKGEPCASCGQDTVEWEGADL